MSEPVVNENSEMTLIIKIKREQFSDGLLWSYSVEAPDNWRSSGCDEKLSDAKSRALIEAVKTVRAWNVPVNQ